MHNSLNRYIDYLVIKYISIIKQRKLHISFLYPNFGTGTISLMSGTNWLVQDIVTGTPDIFISRLVEYVYFFLLQKRVSSKVLVDGGWGMGGVVVKQGQFMYIWK